MARFDWYQATVDASVPAIREALLAVPDGPPAWEEMRKAPHGYAEGARLVDPDGLVAQIWWGGTHSKPHVVFSGETARPGSEVLRSVFEGRHTVSRADVCIDYAEPGAYDRLQGLALTVARDSRIKVGTAGDHLVTMEGRTLYLGSPKSHTMLRLYDKAAELRAHLSGQPQKLANVPSELARLECQVRPQTPLAKAMAAEVDPVCLMGSAAWMRKLMQMVGGLELEPFEAGRPWRQADDERAYAALLGQYGKLLTRRAVDHGGWDMLGRQLSCDLAERAQARAKGRG